MKRSKILRALVSSSHTERIDEIDGSITPLLQQRKGDLTHDEAKAIIGVLLASLTAPRCGKAERRLINITEVIGSFVATGDDRAKKANLICADILLMLKKIPQEKKNLTHLKIVMSLLSGICNTQGPNVLGGLLPSRTKVDAKSLGKPRRSTEDREAYKASLPERKQSLKAERAAAIMKEDSCKELLIEMMRMVGELLPEPSVVRSFFNRCRSLIEPSLEVILSSDEDVILLPAVVCVLSQKPKYDNIPEHYSKVAEAITLCVRKPNIAIWKWVQEAVTVLDLPGVQEHAKKAFELIIADAKRAIESVLPALCCCASVFQKYLEPHAKGLIVAVEPMQKSTRDARLKTVAQSAFARLLRFTSDGDLRKAVIASFCQALKDSKSTEEKMIMIESLDKIVPILFESKTAEKDVSALVKDVVYPALKPFVTAHHALALIQKCVIHTSLIPEFTAQMLKELSNASCDELVRHRILSILPNIAEVDKKKAKEFQPALTTICKDSEKKPASRVDALVALSVADLVATEKWYKDGCLGHTPTIFSVDNIRRPTEDYQLIAAIRSCQRFLPPKTAKCGAAPGFKASKDLGPLMGLCLLATHPRHCVRKEATDALLAAITADADLKYAAWTAFLMILWGQPAASTEGPPSPTNKSKPKSAKPAGKKGKPAPKAAKGAAAVPAAFVHPLVVEKPKYGKKRFSLWDLTGEGSVLGENSRREDPAAANLFSVLTAQLCADENMSDDLLSEIVMTSGHSAVAGPVGNFWTCVKPNLHRYYTESRSDAFCKTFGNPFDKNTMSPDAKTMSARLWRSKQAVTQQLIEGLECAGDKPHTKTAIARALCFIVNYTGFDGLLNSLVVPPPHIEYPDASESEDEDENAEPKPAKEPIVTMPLEYTRLIELITKKTEILGAISTKDAHVFECTPHSLEAAIQKQLEDDDVVPRYSKEDHNVKRDKSQKKLYSAEDEEWEREMVRRRNAEKGIEDPKVAKARSETRIKFNEIRSEVGKEVEDLNGYLMTIIEIARYSKNMSAVHNCLPVIVPAITKIIRTVEIKALIELCTECLEWLFLTTPVAELHAMAGTMARMSRALVIGRKHENSSKEAYPEWVVSFVEHVVSKRIRAACSRLLPSTSYSIIFPTIQEVLRNTSQHSFGALCLQQVLAITSTNCGVADLPHRTETSAALLVVIERTPTLSKTGTASLALLSHHFQPEELGPVTAALINPATVVRESVLVGLKNYPDLPQTEPITRYRILACTQDENKGVSRKADDVWKHHGLTINDDFIDVLVPTVLSHHETIVESTSGAMAVAIEKFPDLGKLSLQQMFRAFDGKLSSPTTLKSPDRKGVATAISTMIKVLTPENLELVSKFCTARGLCDPLEEVRDAFLCSYQKVIATHGREHQASLYPTLQKFFQGGPPTALGPGGAAAAITPSIKESYTSSIVVLMGTLSAQMDKSDHLESLVSKLVDILNTPSAVVARAVCDTMEILVKLEAVAPLRQKVVTRCLDKIVKGSAMPLVRRSYAHGLVGLVKGSKLPSLHEFKVLKSLYSALEGKGHAKEGALIALTVFSERMEGLYEPYVIDQIGRVVESFSDKETSVKKAAEECAAAMMRSLTHFGVRQILPPLLASFDTENWRTSCSALNLLGQMSFCSPQQLSAALPKVMPVLVETLTSSHREVQTHAWDALRRVGGVIMNPEIAAHANSLLQALRNPSTETDNALEALLYTRFTNSIDAASLAVIEPILRRGLTERESTIKLKSAQIIGSVAMLIEDPTLILPYLEQLLIPLKKVLIDEFPDCRSTAAKALGSLVNSLGEEKFPGIVDWCFETLSVPENSHVERSGAAQGACEVIAAVGGDKLEAYLSIIKDKTSEYVFFSYSFFKSFLCIHRIPT